QPPLELVDGAAGGDSFPLIAKVRESTLQDQAKQIVTSNLTTLRNRVNQLGVAEPLIQQQGASRIVVELPGVQDTAEAKKILGAQATLEYHAVDESANPIEAQKSGIVAPDSRLYYENRPGPDGKPMPIVLKKKIIVGGDELVDAAAVPDQQTGLPAVDIRLNAAGGK